MGAREHRQFGMAVREFAQQRVNAAQTALQHEAAALQHQRVRDVVDVLGRAGEVDELRRVGQCRYVLRAAPDEVFHRSDVVVGLGFDRLDLGAVLDVEIGDQLAQARLGLARQPWQLGQAEHRQVDKPLDLNPQPLAHERVFGEDFAQLGSLTAVAAVQRRKCSQGEQFEGHGGSADTGTRRGNAQSGATSVAKQHHSPACSACGHRARRGCRYTGLSLPCKIFACVKEHPPAGFADQPVRAQGAHRDGREAHRLHTRLRRAGRLRCHIDDRRSRTDRGRGPVARGGGALFDSRATCEYLARHDPRRQADSALGTGRAEVRTWEALADGVIAAILVRLEQTQRPPEQQGKAWIERQMGKLHAGVAAMSRGLGEKSWCNGQAYSLADIAVGCALGYLDFRFGSIGWRGKYPGLGRHYEKLAARPSFVDTQPPK
jgi:glutathione S-transferase